MKLSRKIEDNLNDNLIIRINEIYHDLENAIYHDRQRAMFGKERAKWVQYAHRYLIRNEPLCCLDYGSGTGFVPLVIGPFLKTSDTLICTDLSKEMLRICEANLSKYEGINCKKEFIGIDGYKLPINDESVDVITLNSVLHHLPNLTSFAKECERVLKKDGIIIIAHEPNGDIKIPSYVKAAMALIGRAQSPSKIVFSIVEKNEMVEASLRKILSAVSKKYRMRNKMLDDISIALMEEGSIGFKLRGTEVQQLVDIHTSKGLKKETLLDTFSSFELLEWHTYAFLNGDSGFIKPINRFLENSYPEGGGSLSFVLKRSGYR